MARQTIRMRRGIEAREQCGPRLIVRSRCAHRQPCALSHLHEGRAVHSDGWSFADECAARRLNLTRFAVDGCGEVLHAFRSWEEARAWLADGCRPPDA